MSTAMESLTLLYERLAEDRNAFVERLALTPGGTYDQADINRIAQLHGALLAVEAVRETHLPKIGSGSEE